VSRHRSGGIVPKKTAGGGRIFTHYSVRTVRQLVPRLGKCRRKSCRVTPASLERYHRVLRDWISAEAER
jgi:hypothetical protein